jgi:hypothetical protein
MSDTSIFCICVTIILCVAFVCNAMVKIFGKVYGIKEKNNVKKDRSNQQNVSILFLFYLIVVYLQKSL